MPAYEVRRDDLRATRLVDGEARAERVAEGEVQLQVERFGLSADSVMRRRPDPGPAGCARA